VRAGGPTAVLLGDLPALRPGDLQDALAAAWRVLTGPSRRCPPRMAFVPDTDGSGTVLLAATAADAMDPAFGTGSAAEHARRGATRLELPLPRLRRDVDDLADLEAALALGCGPQTTALLDGGALRVVPSDDLGAAHRDPRDGRIA
jgi:2-phospho-L-lactate guanylyltransferase